MTVATVNPTDRTQSSELEQIALEATCVCHKERVPEAPSRVLIVPWGEVRSEAGDFIVDSDGANQAIAAFAAHGADLPVDYEHQTLGGTYASPNGQAPAAGWITGLRIVMPEDLDAPQVKFNCAGGDNVDTGEKAGLWADVAWTDDARSHLEARRYRYLSPVALIRKRDRKLVGVHSVALTNKPAIVGMTPVVNGAAAIESDSFDLAPLKSVLRLDETASAATVIAGAIARVRELERRECERAAERRVEEAFRAGKLAAPQRAWAFALALKDVGEFDRWLATAPVVVPLGCTTAPSDRIAIGTATSRAITSAAQSEWQANRAFLERLCTEEAYVAAALRDAN